MNLIGRLPRWILSLSVFFLFTPSILADSPLPTLNIVAVELPPFIFEKEGEVHGLMVDIIVEASRRTHLPVAFSLTPWQRAMTQIQFGDADAIIPTQYKPEREQQLTFPATPLHLFKFVVVSRSDLSANYTGKISDLYGANFVQLRGASIGPVFDQLVDKGLIKPQLTNNFLSITRMIAARRADYSVLPQLSALYYQQTTGLDVAPLMPVADQHPVYLAFSKTSNYPTPLIERWAQAIANMQRDGSINALERAYIERYLPQPSHL
ncbi:transporter substrate-binding domain-containing protein [Simiduia litorea]|uniref:substrate-binding periplasmic protein n=1 Tax=Simiduia litorea TaxID=1435348 RepID=UPI0036F2EEFD